MSRPKNAPAFHPSEYVKEEMKERKMTPRTFAKKTGWSPQVMAAFFDRRMGLDAPKARDVGKVFGTSAVIWNRLQTAWDRWERSQK